MAKRGAEVMKKAIKKENQDEMGSDTESDDTKRSKAELIQKNKSLKGLCKKYKHERKKAQEASAKKDDTIRAARSRFKVRFTMFTMVVFLHFGRSGPRPSA